MSKRSSTNVAMIFIMSERGAEKWKGAGKSKRIQGKEAGYIQSILSRCPLIKQKSFLTWVKDFFFSYTKKRMMLPQHD